MKQDRRTSVGHYAACVGVSGDNAVIPCFAEGVDEGGDDGGFP